MFLIDSCAQDGAYRSKYIPTLSFNGTRSEWCSWQCPNVRENVALKFAYDNLPSKCDFIFKINAKYHIPTFYTHLARIPESSMAVLQLHDQRSEIFGMRRDVFEEYLRYPTRGKNQEYRLSSFVKQRRLCSYVHRMDALRLENFTRRSDGVVLTSLR